jgi:hypothetical protein
MRLAPSDGAQGDHFGTRIDTSCDLLIAGASRHDHDGMINSGAAYLFTGVDLMPRTADINADGTVNVVDLVEAIMQWGPCAY